MEKQYDAVYLHPVRPDFALTMTLEEKEIMNAHVVYWTGMLKAGKVIAFGPVMDPESIYGLGIVAVESEQELKQMIEADRQEA